METKFLTMKAVVARTSLSRTTLWRQINAGNFPKPVRLAGRRVAFDEAAVEAWIREKLELAA